MYQTGIYLRLIQSLKHSTFTVHSSFSYIAFTMHSPCIHLHSLVAPFALIIHKVLTVCFLCFHIAFNLHSPFIQCSCIVQSVDIKFRLIAIHTCILLFFLDYRQNIRITPKTLQINHSFCIRDKQHSHIVFRAFTVYFCAHICALCLLTVHNVCLPCLPFTQSVPTIC